MQATKRKRPLRRAIAPPPQGADLAELADRATYVGSGEHKEYPSFAGDPAPRSDATLCDASFKDPAPLTAWLREALRSGQGGELWEGEFPRYVWFRDEETSTVYEGRLVNRAQGQYKGYALDPERDTIPIGV